jgi:branched-chain amino acid transport system permease protein
MRAVSFDMKTARLMGVNVNRTIAMTFAIGSMMAAMGGMLIAMDQPRLTPMMGLLMGLKAFVAAVLGGIGSVPGAALGGLLLGVAEAIVGGVWSTTYAEAVAFVILVLVLLIKPSGLLGKAGREKV